MDQGLNIIRGACGHDCPDTCTWVVTVRDGEAIKLAGDKEHPFTRGALCAKVNRYLDRVYHPERVLYPLKRIGKKGAGEFARVSWDEALADVADRWKKTMNDHGAEAIMPYSSAGNQGLVQMASLDRRLFGLLGATRLERNICGEVAAEGMASTQGNPFGIDPEDIIHSKYIVLWGTNTLVTNLHLWPIIIKARNNGAKLVVVDPIKTRTGEQADWHLPIRPASDAALALAMMHVIIRDGLVDHDYVSQYADGYEQLVERVQSYPPSVVAGITGISATDIERLAHEYATIRPSLLRPLIGIEHHHNGAMMFRTITCLPILIGAWREKGGGMARSTSAQVMATLNYKDVLMEHTYKPNVRSLNMRDLGRDLCSKTLNPPIKSLCIYNCNPVNSVPNQSAITAGLMRDDLFTVVHDLFVTETARYADYIFPATSQLESLDILPAWGHHYLSLNRPAIAPLGESVCNTEFFRRLARALGRQESWLYESDESMIRTILKSDHPWMRGVTYERLWEEGYVRLNPEHNWRPFVQGGFATKSGKASLWSEELHAQHMDPLPSPGTIRSGDINQLQLITGKTLHFLNSSYSHIKHHRTQEGSLYIELNKVDIQKRGITDRQLVRVFNQQGSIVAECRQSERVQSGIAWMPFGIIGDALGSTHSINTLTPEEPTDWGGGSGFYDAFVDVQPL